MPSLSLPLGEEFLAVVNAKLPHMAPFNAYVLGIASAELRQNFGVLPSRAFIEKLAECQTGDDALALLAAEKAALQGGERAAEPSR